MSPPWPTATPTSTADQAQRAERDHPGSGHLGAHHEPEEQAQGARASGAGVAAGSGGGGHRPTR